MARTSRDGHDHDYAQHLADNHHCRVPFEAAHAPAIRSSDLLRGEHATKFAPILSLYTRTIRWLWRSYLYTSTAHTTRTMRRHSHVTWTLSLTLGDADTTRTEMLQLPAPMK